jgi:hypothetical protein
MMVLDASMLLPKSKYLVPSIQKWNYISVILELDTPIGLETISTNKNDYGR